MKLLLNIVLFLDALLILKFLIKNIAYSGVTLFVACAVFIFLTRLLHPVFFSNLISSINIFNIQDSRVFQSNLNTLIQVFVAIVIIYTFLGGIEQVKVLNKQTEILSNQFRISTFVNASVMGVQCLPDTITGGDSAAYSMLLDLRNNMNGNDAVKIIDDRISFIKSQYANLTDRVKSIPVFLSEKQERIEKENLYSDPRYFQTAYAQINHTGFWQTRAKVCYLMRFLDDEKLKEFNIQITKKDILKNLVEKMKTDSSLFVRRMALESYESLSEGKFQAKDALDFDGAIENWENLRK